MTEGEERLRRGIGVEVTLVGVAEDCKAGAAVVLDGDIVVMLDGVHFWRRSLAGRRVSVSGVLRHSPMTAEPSGEVAVQYASGDVWRIEAPKVAEAP